MANKNYINIYNNLVKFSRNKSIFSLFTKNDTFSDRLLIFLFHFGFFLKEYKKTVKRELLQNVFDYVLKELEISIQNAFEMAKLKKHEFLTLEHLMLELCKDEEIKALFNFLIDS